MTRKDPQLNLRLPAELKDMLEQAAEEHNRSVTAETVERLRQSFAVDKSSINTMFVLSRYEVRIAQAEGQATSFKILLAAIADCLAEAAELVASSPLIEDENVRHKVELWKSSLTSVEGSGVNFDAIVKNGLTQIEQSKADLSKIVEKSNKIFFELSLDDQKKVTRPEDHGALEDYEAKKPKK